jgi:hypothetical protein
LFDANQSGLIDLVCWMNRLARGEYLFAGEEEGAAMRKHRIFRIFVLVGFATAIGGGTLATAEENRGTFEQQMACTPDVFRLCGAAIPDTNRIVACLRSNTLVLSAPCRAVFESSDSAPTPPPQSPPQPPASRPRVIQ